MPKPLHDDDPDAQAVTADGRVVRNLSPDEYAASYADGHPHTIPPEVLEQLDAEAARIAAERGR